MQDNLLAAQYSVAVDDVAGDLHRIALALAREHVGVRGLSLQRAGGAGFIRFITERDPAVKTVLEQKLHEALISEPESIRVTADGDMFRMAPAHATIATDAKIFGYQSSDDLLTKDDLAHYLEGLGIFARSLDDFVGRQIEEIATPAARRPSS